MDIFFLAGILCYCALGGLALFGAFYAVLIWMRVASLRFRNEKQQEEFLEIIEEPLAQGQFEPVLEVCEQNSKAISRLAVLAIENRSAGYAKVRQLVLDRFQRDILTDLDHRMSWVNTVIKSAPMVGLFGTVIGMIGAFRTLATPGQAPDPADLAQDISVALYTTASGLAIAIPLLITLNSVNVRIRRFEDLVAAGLTRFFEAFRAGTTREA